MSDDIRDDDDSILDHNQIPEDPIVRRNRQNAQHSTGPKTAEGKAVSSENATKHGHRSKKPQALRAGPGPVRLRPVGAGVRAGRFGRDLLPDGPPPSMRPGDGSSTSR
ncbi:MAG: hypothetical protein U0800_00960 [Isosphaeraceae bacterium]